MRTFCGYRTKLLPQARAERFFRCQAANPAFTNVELKESKTAKNAYQRHYVVFAPVSPERAATLRQAEASTRQARAEEQSHQYHFWADPDSTGLFWCLNLNSQDVYEVTLGSCTCPDHTYRGSQHGVPCKHMLLLKAQLEAEAKAAETERWVREQYEQAEREACDAHARYLAQRNEDFPDF